MVFSNLPFTSNAVDVNQPSEPAAEPKALLRVYVLDTRGLEQLGGASSCNSSADSPGTPNRKLRVSLVLCSREDPLGDDFGSKVTPWQSANERWKARGTEFILSDNQLLNRSFLQSANVHFTLQVSSGGGGGGGAGPGEFFKVPFSAAVGALGAHDLGTVNLGLARIFGSYEGTEERWLAFDDEIALLVKCVIVRKSSNAFDGKGGKQGLNVHAGMGGMPSGMHGKGMNMKGVAQQPQILSKGVGGTIVLPSGSIPQPPPPPPMVAGGSGHSSSSSSSVNGAAPIQPQHQPQQQNPLHLPASLQTNNMSLSPPRRDSAVVHQIGTPSSGASSADENSLSDSLSAAYGALGTYESPRRQHSSSPANKSLSPGSPTGGSSGNGNHGSGSGTEEQQHGVGDSRDSPPAPRKIVLGPATPDMNTGTGAPPSGAGLGLLGTLASHQQGPSPERRPPEERFAQSIMGRGGAGTGASASSSSTGPTYNYNQQDPSSSYQTTQTAQSFSSTTTTPSTSSSSPVNQPPLNPVSPALDPSKNIFVINSAAPESFFASASSWFRERTAEAISSFEAATKSGTVNGNGNVRNTNQTSSTFVPYPAPSFVQSEKTLKRQRRNAFLEQLSAVEIALNGLRYSVKDGLALMRGLAADSINGTGENNDGSSLPALVKFLERAVDPAPLRNKVRDMESSGSSLETSVEKFRDTAMTCLKEDGLSFMGGADNSEAFDDCALLLDSLLLLQVQVIAEFKVLLCRLELLASEYGSSGGDGEGHTDLVGALVLVGGGGSAGMGRTLSGKTPKSGEGGGKDPYFTQLSTWAEGLSELLRSKLPVVTVMVRDVDNRSARLREIVETLRSGVLQG